MYALCALRKTLRDFGQNHRENMLKRRLSEDTKQALREEADRDEYNTQRYS